MNLAPVVAAASRGAVLLVVLGAKLIGDAISGVST
jgi:hypothetical protein